MFIPLIKSKNMKVKNLIQYAVAVLLLISFTACNSVKEKHFTIVETTDIHGVVLPYDFTEKQDLDASLANSATCINEIRKSGEPLFLLDNGDNLQGQPEVYYYNFIDTIAPHFLAQAMNWLKFDATTAGNHDIETGHAVYDRIRKEYHFPMLAANAIDVSTGKPYFTPYVILEHDNIRIAVLGLITPQIPEWLPRELYSGIEFRDMTETAKIWMPEIKKKKPDLIVGLFHSGFDKGDQPKGSHSDENGTAAVAYNVPGFDIIFCGHDHKLANEKIVGCNGDSVLILNGGSRSENLARAEITIKGGSKKIKIISGEIVKVRNYMPDSGFMKQFDSQNKEIRSYVDRIIGVSTKDISTRDAYFGSSAFIDQIHLMQLEITGADVSFAAPLSFDVKIAKGNITVGDMFKLYRFENMLYTVNLTGEEIHKYLEYSYSQWINTMKGPGDYLLKLRMGKDSKPVLTNGKAWLRNQAYNFDSGAGIDYTVDVSKPEGERVKIKSFSDGRPFEMSKMYKVAINSYRGTGGGGHLTQGAGLSKDELDKRIISSTDRDLRYYILKLIETKKVISPEPLNNWSMVPADWVRNAEKREYRLLFGE
jgi:2',3'-cyclic-nucleotide 2'-phosphodiesterase / 3'-nucleotidase